MWQRVAPRGAVRPPGDPFTRSRPPRRPMPAQGSRMLLFSAQHHLRAIPDHAVVVGKWARSTAPMRPVCRVRRSSASARHGASPGNVPACGPPVLPVAAPGRACLQRITRRPREGYRGPSGALPAVHQRWSRPRSASHPRRLDQPHRHVDRALQFAREVEASGGKIAHRIRRCRCPGSAVAEGLLCLHGGGTVNSRIRGIVAAAISLAERAAPPAVPCSTGPSTATRRRPRAPFAGAFRRLPPACRDRQRRPGTASPASGLRRPPGCSPPARKRHGNRLGPCVPQTAMAGRAGTA